MIDNNSQNTSKSNFIHSVLTGGIIIGTVAVLYDLILLKLFGLAANPFFVSIQGVLTFFIPIYIIQKLYRDTSLNGYISYGKAFKLGLFAAACGGIIIGAYIAIRYKINPHELEALLEQITIAYQKIGLKDAQVNEIVSNARNMMGPIFTTITHCLSAALSGLFYSLISSLIVRRKNPDSFNDSMSKIKE